MQQIKDRSLREMETGSESYESGGEEGMEILEEEEEEEEEDKGLDFRKLCLQEGWMADDGEEEEEEHELQGSQLAVARASVETTTTIPAWEEEELGMGELEEACVTSSFSSSLPPPLEKGGREKKILGKSLQRKNECIEESSLQMLDSMSKPPPPPPRAADDDGDDDDDNGGAEMIEISPEKSTQLQMDHKGCRHDTMETKVLDMLTVDAEKEMAATAVMDVVVSLPADDIKKQSNSSAVGKEEEDHFQQFGNTNSLAEEEAQKVSSQQDVHDPTSANEYPANCNRVAVTEVKKVPEVVELSTSCSPCIPIVDDDCTAAANALAGKDESHKEENLQQQRRRRRKKDGNVEEERVVEGAVVIVHHAQQCDNNELLKNHYRGGVIAEEDAFLMGNGMGCCCLDAEVESKHNRAENEGGAIRAAALVADDGGEKDYGGGGALSSSSSLLYNSASFGNTHRDNGVVAEEEDIKQVMEEEACNGEEDGDRGIDIRSQKRKYVGEAEAKQKQQQVCKLQSELLQEGIMLAECPPPTPLPPCGGGGGGCAGDVQQLDHCASVAKENQSVTDATSRARCVDAKQRQPPAVGFTAHQLGQLYSLMHEHVQLLIQVFALSILEPAQQQTAIETHHMLVDLMQSRDWMLMWKKTAFPDFCFSLPFIHPSVVVDNSNSNSSMCDPSPATKNPHSQDVAAVVKLSEPTTPDSVPSEIRNTHLQTDSIPDLGRSSNSQENMLPLEAASQTEHRSSISCPSVSNAASVFPSSPSEWVPKTCGSVRTLLDVAPLHLVNEFLTDIAQVVQNYRQQHVESGAYHAECERDTLFPTVKLQADHDLVAEGGSSSSSSSKKKKQSVALVPKGISKSVRRFLPLFNKGLFPNKAPPATTANRMLFTDAEDELLAMGMITYNTDWLAIQWRFLPSKSVHQIFVRQKNRSCARSPENPIKAVRRMKSAPFTAEEKECIEEALIVYKYDWARIWQFCVPHRDPVALPRQWRVALGTQKLYESHEMNEEKRQAYETGRHLNALTSSPRDETPSSSMWVNDLIQGPVECSGDGDTNDTEDKQAHILNAFFAEWKPRSPLAWLAEGKPCMPEPSGALSSSTMVSKTEDHMKGGNVPTLPVLLPLPIPAAPMPPPMYPYSPYAPPIHTFPSRQQAKKWLVKLAPGLPSLKLPPTVQVLSQSKGGEHPKTVTPLGCSRGGAGSQANLPGPQGIELTGSDAIPPIKPSTVLPLASSSRKASVQEEVVLGKRIKCDWQLPNPDLAPKRKCVENDTASINNQIAIQYNQAAASVRQQQQQQPPPRSHPVVSQQQTAGRRSLKTLLMKPVSSSSPATRGRRTMPFPIATPPRDDIKVLAGQAPLHYQSPHFHPFFGAPPPMPIVVSKFLPANLPPPCTNSPTPSMVLHRTGTNNRPAAPTASKNGQQHASV